MCARSTALTGRERAPYTLRMGGLGRAWVPGAPLLVWGLLLATKSRLWAPVPRMTGGNGPPFAAIGTIAVVFGATLLAVAVFHHSRLVAYLSGAVGAGITLVYLVLALQH